MGGDCWGGRRVGEVLIFLFWSVGEWFCSGILKGRVDLRFCV
jgi:hypothetical protein